MSRIEKKTLPKNLYRLVTYPVTNGKETTAANLPSSQTKIPITTYSSNECEELVFLRGRDFEDIFGEPDSKRSRRKSSIVKITNVANGISIHRMYRNIPEIKLRDEYAVVTYSSIRKLTRSKEEMNTLIKVTVSEGSVIPFYWNHPNPATRITVKFGVWSIVIAILSLFISIACSIYF